MEKHKEADSKASGEKPNDSLEMEGSSTSKVANPSVELINEEADKSAESPTQLNHVIQKGQIEKEHENIIENHDHQDNSLALAVIAVPLFNKSAFKEVGANSSSESKFVDSIQMNIVLKRRWEIDST